MCEFLGQQLMSLVKMPEFCFHSHNSHLISAFLRRLGQVCLRHHSVLLLDLIRPLLHCLDPIDPGFLDMSLPYKLQEFTVFDASAPILIH
jgi:hypothetical protein